MIIGLALVALGALLAAPFAVAILRASTLGRVLWLWAAQLATALALWLLLVWVFHSGLIVRQDLRALAALFINLVWVALVAATFLGTSAAVFRAVRLGARRTNGK